MRLLLSFIYLESILAVELVKIRIAVTCPPLTGKVGHVRLDLAQLTLLHQKVDIDLCNFPQCPDVLAYIVTLFYFNIVLKINFQKTN